MASVAPNTASTLWEVLQERSLNDPTQSPSLYHDEDAATWYTYHKAGIDKKKRFPTGPIMLTYGKITSGGQAMKIKACNLASQSNIDPHCEKDDEDLERQAHLSGTAPPHPFVGRVCLVRP